jgi:TRAP-type C4-dicarboxylate transport system permease small subunit
MLSKIFRGVDRSLGFLEDWSLFLAVSAALLVALANIVLRKATSHVNIYWSDEVVRKVIYFSTYIGCVAAVRSRSLIRIDVLIQLVPVTKRFLTLVNHLAVLLFSVLMVWLGWLMTVSVYQDEYARTSSLQIPEWYFYAILPLMGGMMFVRTIIVAVEDWTGVREGAKP